MDNTKTLAEMKAEVNRLHDACLIDYEAAITAYDEAIAAYDEARTGGYEWFRELMAEIDHCMDIDRQITDAMFSAIDNACATMAEKGRKDDIRAVYGIFSKETVGHVLASLQSLLASPETSENVLQFYRSRGVRY